jgi:glycosyltransferase involved in cell wall biosynthesis
MHVLFVHRAFPAQFGRLALELSRRYGWQCSFLIEHLSSCPPPTAEMLAGVRLYRLPSRGEAGPPPWPRSYGEALLRGQAAFDGVRGQPGLRPDLVVGHGGLLPTMFLREVLDCPIIDYCEYYFAPAHCDLTYRLDLPPNEAAAFHPRCINAATLVNLVACDSGYAPTEWQRRSFPARFHDKIEVHFDGVDTELYQPRPRPKALAGRPLEPDTRVVTFAARGLESLRGFDLFVRLAREVARQRPDVLFVVVGGEQTHYGWDHAFLGGKSFKEWALAAEDRGDAQLIFSTRR